MKYQLIGKTEFYLCHMLASTISFSRAARISVSAFFFTTGLCFFGMSGNMMNISINTQAVAVEALYKRSIMASFHGLWSLAGFTGAAIGTFMVSQNLSPFMHFVYVSVLIICIVLLFIK